MRLPGAMAAFAGNAHINIRPTCARLPMAGDTFSLELRTEDSAESGFVSRGFFFRESRRKLQAVRRSIVQVAALDQRSAIQFEPANIRHTKKKADTVPLAPDRGLDGEIDRLPAGHLHFVVEAVSGSSYLIKNRRIGPFRIGFRVVHGQLFCAG